jgi:hypothetical protein
MADAAVAYPIVSPLLLSCLKETWFYFRECGGDKQHTCFPRDNDGFMLSMVISVALPDRSFTSLACKTQLIRGGFWQKKALGAHLTESCDPLVEIWCLELQQLHCGPKATIKCTKSRRLGEVWIPGGTTGSLHLQTSCNIKLPYLLSVSLLVWCLVPCSF